MYNFFCAVKEIKWSYIEAERKRREGRDYLEQGFRRVVIFVAFIHNSDYEIMIM